MEIKKILCSLLAGLAIAINSYGDINLPKGYSFFDKSNYYRFNRDITVTKISKDKKIGWLVYDTKRREIIGDEEDEIEEYKKYATMAESSNIMESLMPGDVREMASLYRKGLAGYEIVYRIPNFALEEGSKLEGMLLKAYFTGGKDLPEEAQKRIVKELIDKEKEKIVDEFYKKIFNDEEELNPLEAAEKVKKYLLSTIEARMLDASFKLDGAAEILEKGKREELDYNEYKEFLDNFITGNSTGRAYLKAIENIQDNVNWKSITQKIVKNLSEGFGVKDDIEKISMHTNDLLNIDLASIIFGDGDFMDVFNDIEEEYMKERARLFKRVEGRYSLEGGSISNEIVNSLNNLNTNEDNTLNKKPALAVNLNPKDYSKKKIENIVDERDSRAVETEKNDEARQVVVNYINLFCNKNRIQEEFIRLKKNLFSKNLYIRGTNGINCYSGEIIISTLYSSPHQSIVHVYEKTPTIYHEWMEGKGNLIYLIKEDGSWKFIELVDLSQGGLRERVVDRLRQLASSAISEYAETSSWPKPFGPEPKTISQLNNNPLGEYCNLPINENYPSKNRCYFSYKTKQGKIVPADFYIIEAVGNLDDDPDLEIWQIGVGSKEIRNISKD